MKALFNWLKSLFSKRKPIVDKNGLTQEDKQMVIRQILRKKLEQKIRQEKAIKKYSGLRVAYRKIPTSKK